MKIESKSPGHVAVQCDIKDCETAMSFNVQIGLHNACRKFGWSMGGEPWLVFCDDHTKEFNKKVPDGPYRIALAYVDNHPTFHKGFALSLTRLMLRFQLFMQAMKTQEGVEYVLDLIPGQYGNVAEMRDSVADSVIAADYDAIMWIDSDMIFPDDTIERLLIHLNANEEIDGATGLYTYKVPPYMPHVYGRLDEDTGKFNVASSFPLDEPFQVEGAGFGCLLLRVDVMNRVAKPRFRMEYDGSRLIAGEDLLFCRDAKTKLIMDPTITCGHLTETCITIDHYLNHNDIKVEDGRIVMTDEQRDAIMNSMPHLSRPEDKETPIEKDKL